MYHIYCDESRPEVIGNKESIDKYAIIGGIWIKKENIKSLKKEVLLLRRKHNVYGEIKWKNVSPAKLEFYQELVKLFFEKEEARFRCIVIDGSQVNLQKYHDSDQELGFYKFYYQLIYHWLEWNKKYSIFVDFKKNKEHDRLSVLRDVLNRASMAKVENLQAVESKQTSLIQLTDVLMGAVGYKYNGYYSSEAKLSIVTLIEEKLGHEIKSTHKIANKFNIFKINL